MGDTAVFLSGIRGTAEFGTGERPKSFRETILWLDPNGMTPVTALSAKLKKESVDDPEFNWFEERQEPKRATLSNAPGTGGTTFQFTNTESADVARQFQTGDILQIRSVAEGQPASYAGATGIELIKVASVDSATQITVTRDWGANRTTDVNVAIGDSVLLVGTSFAEGTASASARSSKPTKNLNYTQIFKNAFQLTNTQIKTKARTGDPLKNEKKRAMFLHAESIEQAFIWGLPRASEGGADTTIRTTGGIRYFLSSNVNVNVGAVTDDLFLDSIRSVFDYNAGGAGDQRVCILGNSALNAINKAVRDSGGTRINYTGAVKFYGMKLLEYQIPQGTFMMKTHPMMNVDPIYTKSMFVLNLKGLTYRPLAGRDTKVQENIQNNDVDGRKDQWLTECGLELHFERTMGYYGNLS